MTKEHSEKDPSFHQIRIKALKLFHDEWKKSKISLNKIECPSTNCILAYKEWIEKRKKWNILKSKAYESLLNQRRIEKTNKKLGISNDISSYLPSIFASNILMDLSEEAKNEIKLYKINRKKKIRERIQNAQKLRKIKRMEKSKKKNVNSDTYSRLHFYITTFVIIGYCIYRKKY